jgi:hypothetical protein
MAQFDKSQIQFSQRGNTGDDKPVLPLINLPFALHHGPQPPLYSTNSIIGGERSKNTR